MAESGIRLRLVIIVFTLACLSLAFSSVLLISHFLTPLSESPAQTKADPLAAIEQDLVNGKPSLAWDRLEVLSHKKGFEFASRGIKLFWQLWKVNPRNPELRDIASRIYKHSQFETDRAMVAYLLLEAGQTELLGRLSKPGEWTAKFPLLESEIALHRGNTGRIRFTALDRGGFSTDSRLELDRALAWGYLGDFTAARRSAARVIDLTTPPGVNGSSGIIDISRGLCRRQIARIIQIMSVWDAPDPNFETLLQLALQELMVDPLGLVQVAPRYFDLLCDAAAWTGNKRELLQLYRAADAKSHILADEQRENRSMLEHDPGLRPETHGDLRRILATGKGSDPRARLPQLNEAAAIHDDQRSWRLVAWFNLNTGDQDGLQRLLARDTIEQGAWHTLYAAIQAEKSGDLDLALNLFKKARVGSLANTALLNQARILLRQGRVESAANLAAAARQGIEVRSLGLVHEADSPYKLLFAEALALQSRILRAQGRETESQTILRTLNQVNPDHPELYNAKGLEMKPEHFTETIQ